MNKIFSLLFLFAFISFSANSQSQTVSVEGQIYNANTFMIPVHVIVTDLGMIQTYTTLTDTSNYYQITVLGSNQAMIEVWIAGCNNDTVRQKASNNVLIPDEFHADLNYCPGSGNPQCDAFFKIFQANSPAGGAVPFQIVIYENSTGSNLTYYWDFGDGTYSNLITPTHTYAGNGPYLLCLTVYGDSNCVSTFCDSIEIDSSGFLAKAGFTVTILQGSGPSGINELQAIEAVKVFPVPASDYLTFSFNSKEKIQSVFQVFDLAGKLVLNEFYEIRKGENTFEVDVSKLSSGFYSYRLSSEKGISGGKFNVR